MNVCICGWHFWDSFYLDDITVIAADHNVFVAANRFNDLLEGCGMPYCVREKDVGLEYGAYNYYLMKHWKGGSVLFMHDDTSFSPVLSGGEIIPGQESLRKAADLKCDQAYVFNNPMEDRRNNGKHGRMLWMSDKLLTWCKNRGGLFYDEGNFGYVGGVQPEGCGHYNLAVAKNHQLMGASRLDVHNKLYLPAVNMAIRGQFGGNHG